MFDLSIVGTLVLGLTQVLKMTRLTGKRNRFAPLVALVIGVGLTIAMAGVSVDSVLSGLIASLTAMGLWSGMKKTVQG
jgi:hypothetical protein